MRVGGKDVEGAFVVAGPVIAPEQLPEVAEALRAGIEGVGRRLGYPAGLVTVSVVASVASTSRSVSPKT